MLPDQNLLSIGALSRASGVPPDTLRTWERRYGFPAPVRTQAGHRRYPLDTLGRLQLVMKALSMGHRAAVALTSDLDTLAQLVATDGGAGGSATQTTQATPAPKAAAPVRTDDPVAIHDRMVEHVQRFEGRALDREFRRAWAVLGGMRFIEDCAAPLLSTIGTRWASGELSVAHEHFCSERLRDFLVQQWRPLADASTGPEVILATPPTERHVLGLQLAAAALALHNVRAVFLGSDAPPEDIAKAVRDHGSKRVVLSVSSVLDGAAWDSFYDALRAELPEDVVVVVGGGGAAGIQSGPGIRPLHSFRALADHFRG